MKKENLSNQIDYIMIGVVVLGILIRIFMQANHFTHVDDIGYINFLCELKQDGYSNWNSGWIVAQHWTYAPLQTILTSVLININLGYQINIILGRLVSCASGIGLLILGFFTLKNFFKKETALVLIALISFSWENIIYSSQAEPYEIVVFLGFALFILENKGLYENWKQTVLTSIILISGCYCHYQFFILVFAFYVSLFLVNLKDKGKLIKIIVCGILNVLGTIPLLCFMVKYDRFSHSLNWNMGIGNIFYFNIAEHSQNAFGYVVKYVIQNTYFIFKYFFTISLFSVISGIFTVILIVFSIAGLIIAHRRYKFIAIYSDILILVLAVMVCRGNLTYGPSRHMLYVFPVFLMLIGFGIEFFVETFKDLEKKHITTALVGVFVICFLLSLPATIIDRINKISESDLQDLVDIYSPDIIYGFSWTNDFYLMNIDGYDNGSGTWSMNAGWFEKYNDNDANKDSIMIISRNIMIEDFFNREDLQQQFLAALTSHGYSITADDVREYEVIYKKEIHNGVEVEYASDYYSNYPNGLCIYIIANQNYVGVADEH